MKAILRAAVHRPVAVLMVVSAVCVFGLVSYNRLDLALLPDLSYPTLTVRTEFPGAGPRDVDKRVTEILEKRLSTAGGLVSINSVSRSGLSDINLEFRWDADMTQVRADLESKIDAAELPDGAKKPLVLPYDPNLDPIMRIAVSSRGRSEADLALARRLAEDEVEKELKKLPGVAAAKIRGGREREVAVHLNEARLKETGIGLDAVMSTLSGANRNEAAGLIHEGPVEYVVRSVNELRSAKEIEGLVVQHVNGVPVRIGDLGHVEETYKERQMAAYLNGKEAVLVEVYKKADSNLVAVADAVRARLFQKGSAAPPEGMRMGGGHRHRGRAEAEAPKGLAASLKDWVTLKVLTDESRFIQAAVGDVRNTAILGGILAVLVLYLFLRNGLATWISAGVIGVCLVATFAPMFLGGVSLNIMSLGGLALGVGMLVDNAIVVLESTSRKRMEGLGPFAAATEGVADVAGAITASTLTSVCVFFPIVFLKNAGIAGQIFRDLALTVVFSLLVSLLVALFVIPSMLANLPRLSVWRRRMRVRGTRFGWAGRILGERGALSWLKLRKRRLAGKLWAGFWLCLLFPFLLLGRAVGLLCLFAFFALGALFKGASALFRILLAPAARAWQAGYSALERFYTPFLNRCLDRPALVLLLAGAALALTAWRATTLAPELLPESFTGEFDVKVSFAPGTPLERTASRLLPVEEDVRKLPGVDWVSTTAGVEPTADRPSDEGEHTAHFTVHLERGAHEQAIRDDVERRLHRLPDLMSAEFLPSTFFRFAIPLEIIFFGGEEDLAKLSRAARETAAELRKVQGVDNVRVGVGRGAREVRLRFDRDQLFLRGLTVEQVANRIRDKIEGEVPTALVEGSLRTDVRVRLRQQDRATLDGLLNLDVASPGSAPIPLRAVLEGEPEVTEGPAEIHRVGGRHAAVVTASYKGLDLGSLARDAQAIAEPEARREGLDVRVAGRSREAKESLRALMFALLLSVFLVYAVMAAQFESLVQPLLIMVSLPLAAAGAIAALDLLGLPVSVVVLLGLILLSGIAVNNAIVLIDCANRRRSEFPTLRGALLQAGRERLRPILMTTATTILGLLPLTGILSGLPGAQHLPLGLGGGEAVELRAPMAITVIGGLFTSTVLTLVVIPVLYELVSRLRGGRRAEA